jgi:hypothetical protein
MKNIYNKYSARREINPAFILNQIGKTALKRIEEKQKYKQLDIIIVQLMCGFSLEAALNHIGGKIYSKNKSDISIWKEVEWYNPNDKLNNIAEKLGISIDYSKKPFCYFNEIFKYRNRLVHGRTVILVYEDIKNINIDEDNFPIIDKIPEMKTKWEKVLSFNNAEKWRESVLQITQILCEKAETYNPIRTNDFIDTSGQIAHE